MSIQTPLTPTGAGPIGRTGFRQSGMLQVDTSMHQDNCMTGYKNIAPLKTSFMKNSGYQLYLENTIGPLRKRNSSNIIAVRWRKTFWYVFLLFRTQHQNFDGVLQTFLKSGRPLLQGYGYSEDFLIHIERLIRDEVRNAKEPQYGRIERVYARKVHEIPPLDFNAPPPGSSQSWTR